ncbi:MAG TPA: FAD-binding domain [Polyangiales bacterium]|nr:FAD-binding domain [Polyangiales bacterium]
MTPGLDARLPSNGARVLISGLGIAGPALAHFLLRYGFAPTLVERAPQPRQEGYIIDFWGKAYSLTERMGLLPEILEAGYHVDEVRLVRASGRKLCGFATDVFRSATGGRFTTLQRGDLSAILYRSVQRDVDVRWGDGLRTLEQTGEGVHVEFAHGGSETYDCVVGADGLHSGVRSSVFGPEEQYERFLDYAVAAFTIPGYRPRDEGVYVAYGAPGRQIARFSMRGDRTMFLLVVADPDARNIDPRDARAHRAYLRDAFSGVGWEWPQIWPGLSQCDALYFDRVSQIHLPAWSKGRVVLLGDAAHAPSLLAGQGAGLAIIGAYVLAGELARTRDYALAFQRYEARMRPFVEQKQTAARGFASSFAPRTRTGLVLRALATRALSIPGAGRFALRPTLRDDIELPEYAAEVASRTAEAHAAGPAAPGA